MSVFTRAMLGATVGGTYAGFTNRRDQGGGRIFAGAMLGGIGGGLLAKNWDTIVGKGAGKKATEEVLEKGVRLEVNGASHVFNEVSTGGFGRYSAPLRNSKAKVSKFERTSKPGWAERARTPEYQARKRKIAQQIAQSKKSSNWTNRGANPVNRTAREYAANPRINIGAGINANRSLINVLDVARQRAGRWGFSN